VTPTNAEIRRKLRRSELIPFVERQEPCTVVMEACGALGADAVSLRHEVKLKLYRSYQTGGAGACSKSGAMTASSFSAARKVSPTRSSRLSPRAAANTCVESVRWRPLAFTRP
jgi:hypothetical protein